MPLLPVVVCLPAGSADSECATTPAAASARFIHKVSSPFNHVTSY
jgi:hypothetical protein